MPTTKTLSVIKTICLRTEKEKRFSDDSVLFSILIDSNLWGNWYSNSTGKEDSYVSNNLERGFQQTSYNYEAQGWQGEYVPGPLCGSGRNGDTRKLSGTGGLNDVGFSLWKSKVNRGVLKQVYPHFVWSFSQSSAHTLHEKKVILYNQKNHVRW